MKRVSVIGLGKLGSCMAASMASKGMHVIGVDVNPHYVDLINQGKAPVAEPNLQETISGNRERLRATTDYRLAIAESGVSFIIVPTPSEESGRFSLKYAAMAAREIAAQLKNKKDYHLVVLTSTVVPGSTDSILSILEEVSGKKCGKEFGLCYNPEFIALGSVIRDLMNPDFILIGESDTKAGRLLEEWYESYCDNKPRVVRMNFVNAELTKISVNAFVTTKITFANMLAGICEKLPGADIDQVCDALGLDSRIGRRYLTGALGYGGPCFPRDNKALSFTALEAGAKAPLADSTDRANDEWLLRQVEKIKEHLRPGLTVSVLGLAYKPDTNVIEQSQGIGLAKHLAAHGNRVMVFDSLAMENAKSILKDSVHYAKSVDECLQNSDAVVIVNSSGEFRTLESSDFPKKRDKVKVFDCWRVLREELENCEWVEYVPLGVGPAEASRVLQEGAA